MQQREPAICLRTTDFSETSQVAHFLARGSGVVSLLAKGTKRKKSKSGGALDLMSEGDLVFIASARQGLGTLVEFTETVSHAALRKEASRLNAALYMIELTGELLPEGDPHPDVFDLLHNALGRLGEGGSPVAAVLAYFQWRLLRLAGLLGEMTHCVACGRAIEPAAGGRGDEVYFSAAEGGLICGDCEAALAERYRLDEAALTGLAALAAARAGAKVGLSDRQADALNRLLAHHAAHQLGKPLRMARYVLGG